MSVYTELTDAEISIILADYKLGTLCGFTGIAAGIENSNFFIDTESGGQKGRYVLTIFERMDETELPYFMRLMKHLAARGLFCPDVMPRRDKSLLFDVHGKQGCIVSCLSGKTLEHLNASQLRASGYALAQLHVAGADFGEHRDDPTGTDWLAEKVGDVMEKTRQCYGKSASDLLAAELDFQRSREWRSLPRGVIHGDLFVDNILFEEEQVSGIIDFYYAHDAAFAVDIAITLNAQAFVISADDKDRVRAFLDGYESVRPLSEDEYNGLPCLLRLTALRFWVSRLYDELFPRGGAMTQSKDPEEYRKKLLLHRQAESAPR